MYSENLVAGQLAALAGLGALRHLESCSWSALTRYSVVTPKRPEATCLIAERSESPACSVVVALDAALADDLGELFRRPSVS